MDSEFGEEGEKGDVGQCCFDVKYIPEDREMALKMVKICPSLFKRLNYTLRDDKEIVLAAVRGDATMLKFAGRRTGRLLSVVLEAMKQNKNAIKFLVKPPTPTKIYIQHK